MQLSSALLLLLLLCTLITYPVLATVYTDDFSSYDEGSYGDPNWLPLEWVLH